MLLMPTISISKETLALLMEIKAEKIRKGYNVTHDDIIRELLKEKEKILPEHILKDIERIKNNIRNGIITKEELTIEKLMSLGYTEKFAQEMYKQIMGAR